MYYLIMSLKTCQKRHQNMKRPPLFLFTKPAISLLVGYHLQPTSSSTNQNAALVITHKLDFTKNRYLFVFTVFTFFSFKLFQLSYTFCCDCIFPVWDQYNAILSSLWDHIAVSKRSLNKRLHISEHLTSRRKVQVRCFSGISGCLGLLNTNYSNYSN